MAKPQTTRTGERRNLAARAALVQLIVNDIVRNPSIILSVDMLRTWLQLPTDVAERLLAKLVASGLLREIRRGVWVRGNAVPSN